MNLPKEASWALQTQGRHEGPALRGLCKAEGRFKAKAGILPRAALGNGRHTQLPSPQYTTGPPATRDLGPEATREIIAGLSGSKRQERVSQREELYTQVFRSPQEWAAPQLVSGIQARV